MFYLRVLLAFIFISLLSVVTVHAQGQEYTGYLDDAKSSIDYPVALQAGQSIVVAADAVNGDLDTFLTLTAPDGQIIAQNDDRNIRQLDSAVSFTASSAGSYTITVSRYEPGSSSGDYKLMVYIGDASVLELMDKFTSAPMSGPVQTRETEHFLVHYTLTGEDATSEAYVDQVVKTLEEVWKIQVVRLGWNAPPSDNGAGGDDRMDVYLFDTLKEGSGALGATSYGNEVGDNPNSAGVELYASSSVLQIDNDFSENDDAAATPISLMRATAAHEFHHAIQFGYDSSDAQLGHWYHEATSTWMETITFPDEQDATGYVSYNFQYPEICLGASTDVLEYGDWLFMQSLTDVHGNEFVKELWDNIARYEGFTALEQTLIARGGGLPEAAARYRLQNLVRDYDLAPKFEATVWLEDTITGIGQWSPADGVQELGANYFAFAARPGVYSAKLIGENASDLRLWAVGIRGLEAFEIPLERSGEFSTAGYDHFYLMVFNPIYDSNVEDCIYADYQIDIRMGQGGGVAPVVTWDARFFEPLK
jgi:hypothetical protein